MSAVLEPQAAEVSGPVTEKPAELAIASLNDTVLAHYKAIEPGLTELAEKYRAVAFNVSTTKGMAEAKAGRLELRESGRYAVQRLEDRLKGQANDLKRTIASETARLIAITKPVEDHVNGQIEAREAEIEAEKERKRLAEAARQQRHRDGIAKIRSYADAARLPGMTAERLLKGLSALEAMIIDPAAWEEFATEAAHVLAETTAAVKDEHAAMVAKEAEAARLAQQAKEQAERQAELDRIAAEQAAAAAALAEQQAEIERQRAELEAQQRAAAEAEAQRLQDEQDREDARRRALALEAEAAKPAAPIPMQPPEPLPMPASIPVGEVMESVEPAAAPILADDGKRWKLGEIAALFGVGLTAETVRSLGIEPVATDKRALLFTTLQVIELRTALVAHLMSLEIEYPA